MQIVKELVLFILSFSVVLGTAYAANADEVVSFADSPLWVSSTQVTEGVPVQISTVVMKRGAERAQGTVQFLSNGTEVGTADFSLSESVGGAVVGVSFVPSVGKHAVSAKITEARVTQGGKEELVSLTREVKAETVTVSSDTDRDRTPDVSDTDDDNDGVPDSEEVKNGTDPLVKEVIPTPLVAGVSTSSSALIEQARGVAESTGTTLFASTESFRAKGAAFFEEKVKTTEATRAETKAGAAKMPSIDERATEGFRPFSEQLKDTSGIFEGIVLQAYKMGALLFQNVYAFYLFFIALILWILRKIWKRHSLD